MVVVHMAKCADPHAGEGTRGMHMKIRLRDLRLRSESGSNLPDLTYDVADIELEVLVDMELTFSPRPILSMPCEM